MDEWFGKGLTKRQQGLSCLAYYVIEVTSNVDLFVIDQHTREVEAPITWLNSRELESSDPDSSLSVFTYPTNNRQGFNSICDTSRFKYFYKGLKDLSFSTSDTQLWAYTI